MYNIHICARILMRANYTTLRARRDVVRAASGIFLFYSPMESFIALLETGRFYKGNKDNVPLAPSLIRMVAI